MRLVNNVCMSIRLHYVNLTFRVKYVSIDGMFNLNAFSKRVETSTHYIYKLMRLSYKGRQKPSTPRVTIVTESFRLVQLY